MTCWFEVSTKRISNQAKLQWFARRIVTQSCRLEPKNEGWKGGSTLWNCLASLTTLFSPFLVEQPIKKPAPTTVIAQATTPAPTKSPSKTPSISTVPSMEPSEQPSISIHPSETPSMEPSISVGISEDPSREPSIQPSTEPSISFEPSAIPSDQPTITPPPTKSVSTCTFHLCEIGHVFDMDTSYVF